MSTVDDNGRKSTWSNTYGTTQSEYVFASAAVIAINGILRSLGAWLLPGPSPLW